MTANISTMPTAASATTSLVPVPGPLSATVARAVAFAAGVLAFAGVPGSEFA
jgi:hypothetical protein